MIAWTTDFSIPLPSKLKVRGMARVENLWVYKEILATAFNCGMLEGSSCTVPLTEMLTVTIISQYRRQRDGPVGKIFLRNTFWRLTEWQHTSKNQFSNRAWGSNRIDANSVLKSFLTGCCQTVPPDCCVWTYHFIQVQQYYICRSSVFNSASKICNAIHKYWNMHVKT